MSKVLIVFMAFICAACSRSASDNEPISMQKTPFQKNPHQIFFGYEKIETIKTAEGLREVYKLFASKVPAGQQFTLYGGHWGEESRPLYDLTADAEGGLVSQDSRGTSFSLSDIRFKMGEFRSGEPYEYRLIANDGSTALFTMVIPMPALAVSRDTKASVRAAITSMRDQKFICRGEGFKPREALEVIHHLHNKEEKKQITADAKGRFNFELAKAEGNAQLTIERKNEQLCLDYGWMN
jgi:hypothetical protein